MVSSGVRRHRAVAISGSCNGRGDAGSSFTLFKRAPFEGPQNNRGAGGGPGGRREGALEENQWVFVALSNKPLQRLNACAGPLDRGLCPDAAGWRHAAPRGRVTIARPFGVHPSERQSVIRQTWEDLSVEMLGVDITSQLVSF